MAKPVIRGLRYPEEPMLELLFSGLTIEELLSDYPDLQKEYFLACIEYAAKRFATNKQRHETEKSYTFFVYSSNVDSYRH